MVWFRFVTFALLLAVSTCIVSFEAMPGLCCFLRVTLHTGCIYVGTHSKDIDTSIDSDEERMLMPL